MGESRKNWHKFVIFGLIIIILVAASYFALSQFNSTNGPPNPNGQKLEQAEKAVAGAAAAAAGEKQKDSSPNSLPGIVASSTVSMNSHNYQDVLRNVPPAEPIIENSSSSQQQQPPPGPHRPDAPMVNAPVVLVNPVDQTPTGALIPQNGLFAANNEAWQQFKTKYNKKYSDKSEELKRLAIFNDNSKFISEFNNMQTAQFTLGVNKFADLTRDEINQLFFGHPSQWSSMQTPPPLFILKEESAAPKEEVDWRHLMQEPVDQGLCRDSAIFAVVASVEGAFNRRFKPQTPVKLSETQIIDCTQDLNAAGATHTACSGNNSMVEVFDLLQRNSYSLTTPEIYKMHSDSGIKCQVSHETTSDLPMAKLSGYMSINPSNILEALINSGPLCVALDASQSTFHFYQSGLYHGENCSTETYNHHVTLVGYSSATNGDTSRPHYLMRNSFGAQWGESGYMRLLKDEQRNKCLPQKLAIFPSIAG